MPQRTARPFCSILLGCAYATALWVPLAASGQEGLRNLRPDPARGATIEGLTFSRDVGVFQFGRGQLQLLEPVDGRTVGAVFVGEGRFQMTPPPSETVERGQIQREFGTDVVDLPFRAVVMLFSEITLQQLETAAGSGIAWGPLEPASGAQSEIDEAREYFSTSGGWVDRAIALPLVNGLPGFFYAHFSEDRGEPTIFSVNPLAFEEVSLFKRHPRERVAQTVAQFHRRADYASGSSAPEEELDLVRVHHYDVALDIDTDLEMRGRAALTLTRGAREYVWIPFYLHPELAVDSVYWDGGARAEVRRVEDASELWVDLSGDPGGGATLVFEYSGEMLERLESTWISLASLYWLPIYQFGRESTYRLTFRAPERYTVATVGDLVSRETQDETTTWVFETDPVDLMTFNIGEFDELHSEPEGAPVLTVQMNEAAHQRLASMISDLGGYLPQADDMLEVVGADMTNSFRFFGDVFGPTPIQRMVATEIFSNHGEAYPGLVLLSFSTFLISDERGEDDMFRGHEIAHQWWGISVTPATYRDRWLAEGFAEFSGWWYGAASLGSVDLYHRQLREARERILRRRDEAWPLGLGTRVAESENPGDYQLMIYHKGAWVLHMLKGMMTNPDTGDDSAFRRVMRTFHETYAGERATTRDFQRVVEEVIGVDMTWFFNQWVYGSSIPTYTFSYQLTPQADGTVGGRVRIRQENVPDDFTMIVPILLDFGAEGTAEVRVAVRGAVSESDLPPLPREPDRIVLNPDEAVLAETRTERWQN
jgi:hypothetical protein